MTVSGDGLIHEIVNGLMRRSDWERKVEVEGKGRVRFKDILTIGAIPGGTGNGFIKSLLYKGNEDYDVTVAAFRVLKQRAVEVDLTEFTMEYQPHEKVYSFLSFAWSIFADIDIGSEVIRCCGPARFHIWGALRVFFTRDYFASLRYVGSNDPTEYVLQKHYETQHAINAEKQESCDEENPSRSTHKLEDLGN